MHHQFHWLNVCVRRPSNWTLTSCYSHPHIGSSGPRTPYLISSSPLCSSPQPIICLHLSLSSASASITLPNFMYSSSINLFFALPRGLLSANSNLSTVLYFTVPCLVWTCLASLPSLLTKLVRTFLIVRCWAPLLKTAGVPRPYIEVHLQQHNVSIWWLGLQYVHVCVCVHVRGCVLGQGGVIALLVLFPSLAPFLSVVSMETSPTHSLSAESGSRGCSLTWLILPQSLGGISDPCATCL